MLIFARGLLIARGDDDPLANDAPAVTYRLEPVTCGKRGCRSCPHGPYWYAYYREGGTLHKRYIGRHGPDQPI